MSTPEPFTPIAISAGLLINLATDIFKHHAQALDGTLTGRMLKWAGLIEPNFDNRLRDTLRKALNLYFERHPQYKLVGVLTFFRDPQVAEQSGNYILNRQPIDSLIIQVSFKQHLSQDAISTILIEQRDLDPTQIIPDFLACLAQQLTIPQMALLLEIVEQTDTMVAEIQASETRLKAFINEMLAQKLSPESQAAAYLTGQHDLAVELVETMDAAGLVRPDQTEQTIRARLQPRPALFESGLCRGQLLCPIPGHYFVSHSFDTDTLIDWRETLAKVRELARKDHGRLLLELREIIQAAQVEVEQKLIPVARQSVQELPEKWQALLEVRTERELEESVRDYQDALEVSRRLMEMYQQ